MRVVTLTLNPCVDRTLWVDEFGAKPQRAEKMSGGKGVNVARVLSALSIPCTAIAPAGGESGAEFAALARTEGVNLTVVPIQGNTRTIDTYARIGDYAQQVVREENPSMSAAEICVLRETIIKELDSCAVLAICGSACCPEAAGLVPELIEEARRRNVRTLLDSNGEALTLGAKALPDVLKVNEQELAQLLGPSEDPLHEEAAQLSMNGVGRVLLTLGERGCAQFLGEQVAYCPAPRVECVNAVGSGDCFTAAWLYAQIVGYSDDGALTLASAAGAANARMFPAARIRRRDIEEITGLHLA